MCKTEANGTTEKLQVPSPRFMRWWALLPVDFWQPGRYMHMQLFLAGT